MSLDNTRREFHLRRVRHSSQALYWLFIPLLAAVAFWFFFNLGVCPGGHASLFQLRICAHTGFVPGFFFGLMLLPLGWLFLALHWYGAEMREVERQSGEPMVGHPLRNWRYAYREGLTPQGENVVDHTPIVWFAFEMAI